MFMCCEPSFAKYIYHTEIIFGFFILRVWRVFPGYILSLMVDWFIWMIYGADLYGWFMKMIYVADIFVIFKCGWYIYEIHVWLIYSYVADLWNTYLLKLIDKSFKVQASIIVLKTSTFRSRKIQWMKVPIFSNPYSCLQPLISLKYAILLHNLNFLLLHNLVMEMEMAWTTKVRKEPCVV